MACVMTGGTIVESEEYVRYLSALPEASSGEQEIAIGHEVKLPPCMPDHYLAAWQKERGRPCPRPGLTIDPANEAALELMQISLAEHTRHLFEGALRDLVRPGERATVRQRVLRALRDPVVTERLYPKRDEDRGTE